MLVVEGIGTDVPLAENINNCVSLSQQLLLLSSISFFPSSSFVITVLPPVFLLFSLHPLKRICDTLPKFSIKEAFIFLITNFLTHIYKYINPEMAITIYKNRAKPHNK